MPTIRRDGPYRFYFYSHEPDEPAHVHVDGGGASAKFWLTPPSLARNVGFSARELGVLQRVVTDHRAAFLEAWHEFFGQG